MPDANGKFRGISVPKAIPATDDLLKKRALLVQQERRARVRMEEARDMHAAVVTRIHELQGEIDARRR